MSRLALAAILAATGALPAAAQSPSPNVPVAFSADVVQAQPGRDVRSGRLIVGAPGSRFEFQMRGRPVVQISIASKNLVRLLFPLDRTYLEWTTAEGASSPEQRPADPCTPSAELECKRDGDDTIAGIKVERWTIKPAGASAPIRTWWDKSRRMPLRQETPAGHLMQAVMIGAETYEQRPVERWEIIYMSPAGQYRRDFVLYAPDLKMAVVERDPTGAMREMRNIVVAAPDAALFDVPQGFTKIEQPGQMPAPKPSAASPQSPPASQMTGPPMGDMMGQSYGEKSPGELPPGLSIQPPMPQHNMPMPPQFGIAPSGPFPSAGPGPSASPGPSVSPDQSTVQPDARAPAPHAATGPHRPMMHGPGMQGPMMQGPMMHGPMMQGPMMHGPMMQGPMMRGPGPDQGSSSQGPGNQGQGPMMPPHGQMMGPPSHMAPQGHMMGPPEGMPPRGQMGGPMGGPMGGQMHAPQMHAPMAGPQGGYPPMEPQFQPQAQPQGGPAPQPEQNGGGRFRRPHAAGPQFDAPQFNAPSFNAPGFRGPEFAAPRFDGPRFGPPQGRPDGGPQAAPAYPHQGAAQGQVQGQGDGRQAGPQGGPAQSQAQGPGQSGGQGSSMSGPPVLVSPVQRAAVRAAGLCAPPVFFTAVLVTPVHATSVQRSAIPAPRL